jgi:uncharacterized protein YkwD
MTFKISTGVMMLVVCFNALAGDLYADINRLRAADGACAGKDSLQPLAAHPALERVAAALARGGTLEQSFKTSGYRATHSRAFNIRGEAISARAAELLAKPENCRQLQDAALSEMGIYVDAQQLWLVMAAPFAPVVAQSADVAGRRVLQLVNEARAKPRNCGNKAYPAARPLSWNTVLAAVSQLHADDMARNNYFSHTGRDGSNPAQRVLRAGYNYRATGENIAAGQMKPEDAVAGWIKSPPHCANLMNNGFAEMGVAFAVETNSELGVYWAQEFGAPR